VTFVEHFVQEKPGLSNRSWQYAPQQYQQMKRANELREQMKKFSQLMPAAKLEELIVGLSSMQCVFLHQNHIHL